MNRVAVRPGVQGVAINVGANTNAPGFRGPVFPDGRFEFVPIPETAATDGTAPTYGDLAPHLVTPIPAELRAVPVHLDPTFAEYPRCEAYTYGDPHGVKARPLSALGAGDRVYFYATLASAVDSPADRPAWMPPDWGAYVIGSFRLAGDPVTSGELTPAVRARFETNAHLRREPFDARVLLAGDPEGSRLYDRAVPLSQPTAGTAANDLVTAHSSDSGRGPWWRRPLRLDAADVRSWERRIAAID